MKYNTVTVTIPTGHDDPDSPAAKAAHVADLVRVYRDIIAPGDPLDIAVADLVADLLHYADTIADADRGYGVDGALGPWVAERAVDHYEFEAELAPS